MRFLCLEGELFDGTAWNGGTRLAALAEAESAAWGQVFCLGAPLVQARLGTISGEQHLPQRPPKAVTREAVVYWAIFVLLMCFTCIIAFNSHVDPVT